MGLALLSFCLTATVSGTAVARVHSGAARKAAEATSAYNLGHYDEAAALYEQAYRLQADPALLFNVGQSYRLARQPGKALTAYKSYLRTTPQDAPNRAQAEKRVGEMEAAIAAASLPAAPPDAPLPNSAGVASIGQSSPRQPPSADRAVPLPGVGFALSGPPTAPTPPATPVSVVETTPAAQAPSVGGKSWLLWGAIGAAAVLVGGVVVFAVASHGGNSYPTTALGHQDIFR
jgi:tetratricopeptide (TPR) repeat protein